jgi:hypothetical protein
MTDPNTAEKRLVEALSDLFNAIANADRAGCIDHIDCWDDAEELWFEPLNNAAKLLEEYES